MSKYIERVQEIEKEIRSSEVPDIVDWIIGLEEEIADLELRLADVRSDAAYYRERFFEHY